MLLELFKSTLFVYLNTQKIKVIELFNSLKQISKLYFLIKIYFSNLLNPTLTYLIIKLFD